MIDDDDNSGDGEDECTFWNTENEKHSFENFLHNFDKLSWLSCLSTSCSSDYRYASAIFSKYFLSYVWPASYQFNSCEPNSCISCRDSAVYLNAISAHFYVDFFHSSW